jgi:hypothetical protein
MPNQGDNGTSHSLVIPRLLGRAETSPGYLAELKEWSTGLAVLLDPAQEQQAWSDLFSELFSAAVTRISRESSSDG